jgi:endonuclease III
MHKEELAKQVAELLKGEHPNPKTELNHENEMQLSIAVTMSAQTTDKKVNEVNERLFKKYKTWEDFANANLEEMQSDIHGVNFHKGKAGRIIKMAQMVIEDFDGALPRDIKNLIKLPGVARKSANVIQQELWDIGEGFVVDTHVTRVSNRLGLSNEKNAVKVERDLMEVFPEDTWRHMSGAMVLHGRYVCTAIRKPNCEECVLNKICPSAFMLE